MREEKQDTKTKDAGTTEWIEYHPHTCYLCGGRIPIKQRPDYRCPQCGNRICSFCLEITDTLTPNGVCLSCDQKAHRGKVIWGTIALVAFVIVAAIVLYLVGASSGTSLVTILPVFRTSG